MNLLLAKLLERERKQDELWFRTLGGEKGMNEKPSIAGMQAMALRHIILDTGIFRVDFSPSTEGFQKLIRAAVDEGLLSKT